MISIINTQQQQAVDGDRPAGAVERRSTSGGASTGMSPPVSGTSSSFQRGDGGRGLARVKHDELQGYLQRTSAQWNMKTHDRGKEDPDNSEDQRPSPHVDAAAALAHRLGLFAL